MWLCFFVFLSFSVCQLSLLSNLRLNEIIFMKTASIKIILANISPSKSLRGFVQIDVMLRRDMLTVWLQSCYMLLHSDEDKHNLLKVYD